MRILGIETSCDDTAAAVIEAKGGFNNPSFSVLSNVSYSQIAIHKKFGGVVPNLASRAHLQKIIPTIKAALKLSTLSTSDVDSNVDLIAVTRGPGLLPSLLVGVNMARALAYKWQKPIIGVNHIEGHIYSNWLPPIGKFKFTTSDVVNVNDIGCPNIEFPALILIVSGGHTELVLMRDYGKYKIIGETLDDAVGECFDKTARILGLGFPGGPALAAAAVKYSDIRRPKDVECPEIKLPRPMINSPDYNFSFSGLKTAVLYAYRDLVAQNFYRIIMRQMLAAEIQEAIVDVLISKTLKAVKNLNPKSVMVCGGVSANKRLREEMAARLEPWKIPLFIPDPAYTTDNAAMIATAGYFSAIGGSASGGNYLKKKPKIDSWKKIEANANLRL